MNGVHSLPVDPFSAEKCIGIVSQVTRATAKLTLLNDLKPQNGAGRLQSPPPVEVGQFVVIQCGEIGLFGQLNDIFTPPERLLSAESDDGRQPLACGMVQLLTSIETSTGKLHPGILTHPRIGNRAFVAHPKLVQLIAQTGPRLSGNERVLISFARLPDAELTPVSFTPEMLFGRHCAILGATGGGKSWTLARLVEETARYRAKVIMLDATGEFSRLARSTRHLYLGYDPQPAQGPIEVVLPYYHLTERDLFAIFKPSGQSQAPKLRAAMKSLKLAKLAQHLAIDGTIIKANKSKQHYQEAYFQNMAVVDSPAADFNIKKLARQIENECVKPNRSAVEPNVWGDTNPIDQAFCVPLINRVQDIIQSKDLAPIFDPQGKTSLIDEIDTFLQSESHRVLRISLKYLSFAHNTREIIANAVGRYLLQLARDGRFSKRPLLVLVDEAHQFLAKVLGDETESFPLDSFELIAKEGRKYALNICLATQRPRDIPEGVLSQMGTLVVHRLINSRDREVVERASSEMDRSSVQSLPILTPGEAVIIGVEFPVPLRVRITAPDCQPEFSGADYQQYWRKERDRTSRH